MSHKPRARESAQPHIMWMPRGKILRVIRAEIDVSVTKIAQDIGYSRDYVGQVIRGRRASYHVARAIADYFEKPVEELFFPLDLDNPDQATAA